MKYNYPSLEEPCKNCKYKCFRVEDINFISDKNCKYADDPKKEIKKKLGIKEEQRREIKIWDMI